MANRNRRKSARRRSRQSAGLGTAFSRRLAVESLEERQLLTAVQIDFSGVFNQDAIRNQSAGTEDTADISVDGLSRLITDSWAMTQSANGNGLPDDGFFSGNAHHPDVQLGYQNDDDGNNVVFDPSNTVVDVPDGQYFALHVHAIATNDVAGAAMDVTLNYSDGTSNTVSTQVPDWFQNISDGTTNGDATQYNLIDGMDRLSGGFQDLNSIPIFGSEFAVDATKLLESFTVSKSAGESLVVLGATGESNLVVTTADDIVNATDSVNSLREAVDFANSNSDASTITFASGLGTITLGGTQLLITSDVSIEGPGADQLTVDGDGASAVFRVDDSNAALRDVEISGLKIVGGSGNEGVAIDSNENLTVKGVWVADNHSANSGVLEHRNGALVVSDSTFSGNTGAQGAAIHVLNGTAEIINSTVSGNSATGFGGGIEVVGGTAVIRNSTFTGNRSDSDDSGGQVGGGVDGNPNLITMHNTIVAGNFRGSGTTPSDVGISLLSSSFNLVGDAGSAGGLADGVNGNIVGNSGTGTRDVSTVLNAALADNNGPTLTHAILAGSPAINAGDPAFSGLSFDQRGNGNSRVKQGRLDIGAFESNSLPLSSESLTVTIASDTVDSSDNETSLREAISFANINPGADTITFQSGLSSVNVTDGQFLVEESLTIQGLGKDVLTIQGNSDSRLFDVLATGVFNVHDITLSGAGTFDLAGGAIQSANASLTINVNDSNLIGNRALQGGAINAAGTVNIRASTISGNVANNDGGGIFVTGGALNVLNGSTLGGDTAAEANTARNGGAILAQNGAAVIIDASTISGNVAERFGGGMFLRNKQATITNSTFSGNVADIDGGAIDATFHNSTLTIRNSTIVDNTATNSVGGGLYADPDDGNIIENTIIANNMAGNGNNDIFNPVTANFSLIGDTTGSTINGSNNLLDVDPMLGGLGDNGGLTLTHAPLLGSPVINAGDPNFATPPNTDQRGLDRVAEGRLDIGSAEVQNTLPEFTSDTTTSVNENETVVQSLAVSGATVAFSIVGGADQSRFRLSDGNQLRFQSSRDFENPTDANSDNVYEVTVRATSDAGLTADQTVLVTINPVNDHAPVITSNPNITTPENVAAVSTLSATDGDLPNQSVTFSITGGTDQSKFEIASGNRLRFVDPVDFENPTDANGDNRYEVLVTANDGNGETTNQLISVNIVDRNENTPEFTSGDGAVFQVAENTGVGAVVGNVAASDADAGDSLTFSIIGGNSSGAFAINNNGRIVVANPTPLDFETRTGFNLQLRATDAAGQFDTASVSVNLTNINEAPTITDRSFTTPESTNSGSLIGSAAGSDPESDLTYSIINGNVGNTFEINSAGQLLVATGIQLDFESVPSYSLTVQAVDAGGLNDTATVTVNLTDVDEPPTLDDRTFSILESAPNGTLVGTATASDADAGDTVTYALIAGNTGNAFGVDDDGAIRVANINRVLTRTSWNLTLQATDSGGQSDTAAITINVIDQNEAPTISALNFLLTENSSEGTVVGTVASSDRDSGDSLTFSFISGNIDGAFTIDDNGRITVANSAPLDFETRSGFDLQVQGTDTGGLSDTTSFRVTLRDTNEAPVLANQSFSILNSAGNGTVVGTVTATDPDAGSRVFYSITDGNAGNAFSISNTGQIQIANAAQAVTRSAWSLAVRATDNRGLIDTATITINVMNQNTPPTGLPCDFVGAAGCDINDLNALYAGTNGAPSPLTNTRINQWLSQASSASNPLKPTSATQFVQGDVDLDGDVDSTDLGMLLNSFSDNTGLGWGAGNLNSDSIVDSQDLGLLLNNFAFQSPSAVAAGSASVTDAFFAQVDEEDE